LKSIRLKYLTLNKMFFLPLFILGSLFLALPACGQVSYLPDNYNLKLDEGGNIPPEFWSYEIPFKSVSRVIAFIDLPVDLMKQEAVDLDPADKDNNPLQWNKDKKLVDGVIQTLEKGGVTLDDGGRYAPPEEAVGSFSVSQIGKSDLYLWSADGQSFLVNPFKPSQIVPLYYESGDDDNSDKYIASAQVQVLSPDVYRVFCNFSAQSNGCGAAMSQWLSIFDIDFTHGTLVRTDLPKISWSVDLNQDGNVEVVVSACIDNEVYFPWVYSWDGTKWADRRAQFWNCYQNGKLVPWAFCNAGGLSKAPDALNKAIQAGEPLKYWKTTSSVAEGTAATSTIQK